jgi:hypothetical protein
MQKKKWAESTNIRYGFFRGNGLKRIEWPRSCSHERSS